MNPLLDIQELSVSFDTHAGEVKAVNNVSFQVFPGEAVGIVGESGCGKSVTAQAILRLLPTPPAVYKQGRIVFNCTELLSLPEHGMEKIRGNDISMIFQDPMTSLNPVLTIGRQLTEALEYHRNLSQSESKNEAIELLTLVGIPSPETRLGSYPHQFSGGMRQRVMIAMALACKPKLLIADEPTTALDVTIQAQILELMKKLQAKLDMAVIFISHDLGAIASLCTRVLVMYAGRIVETGAANDIFHNPQHPYTKGLLSSVPRLDAAKQKLTIIEGQPPDLLSPPPGCAFHPRCPYAMRVCAERLPDATQLTPEHSVFCWLQHPDAPQKGGV